MKVENAAEVERMQERQVTFRHVMIDVGSGCPCFFPTSAFFLLLP